MIEVAFVLSQKYDVVVTNPPYMGSGGMCGKLSEYLKKEYPDNKSDTFAAFIERCCMFGKASALIGMFTPYVWMFIQSYEKLRQLIYSEKNITTLIQFEYSAFEEATVPVCSFVLYNSPIKSRGVYFRLTDFRGGMEVQRKKVLEAISNPNCGYLYCTSTSNFKKIPGIPVAYWLRNFSMFNFPQLNSSFFSGGRNKTHDNQKYVRTWWEIFDRERWIPYANGGEYIKWYGNNIDLVDWSPQAIEFYDRHGGLCNKKFWNKEGITWGAITSSVNAFRIKEESFIYSSASPTIFNTGYKCDLAVLGFLNTKVAQVLIKLLNPTLNQNVNDTLSLPFDCGKSRKSVEAIVTECISISRTDWDSFETSWDFKTHPLVVHLNITRKSIRTA
ncbi:MAG: Eco57I restriction-modification methylase domain-containing protein [Thermincola sp.]|nr:Eco57I restriction-modification methylase domain-containing protein [Thermincola sp.]MDT3703613.1 Eco57I restriction-modification methylase domain-containing protein [Thermincola sp.]